MITVNITYFNEPHFLKYWMGVAQVAHERGLDAHFTICDDGSDRLPAMDFFRKNPPPPNVSLFRVTKNVGFNSHGCRNLMMQETETEWNLNCDIDREFNIESFRKIFTEKFEKGSYYVFRMNETKDLSLNDYIVHRDDFWEFGGYDEELTNVHFGDRMMLDVFRKELKRVERTDIQIKTVRGARTLVVSKDTDITQYPDDNTLVLPAGHWWRDKDIREKRIQVMIDRYNDKEARKQKPIIQFPWVQMF